MWSEHQHRLVNDAAYAAATAAIVGGVLGVVPMPNVIAAVITLVLTRYVSRARRKNVPVRWRDRPQGV